MIQINIKNMVDSKYETINRFAHDMSISVDNARKLYNGNTTRISLDILEKLCNVLNCAPNDIFEFDDITNNKSNYNPVEPSSNEYHIFRNYCIDTSQIKDLDDYFDRKIDEKSKNLNVNISTKKDSEE